MTSPELCFQTTLQLLLTHSQTSRLRRQQPPQKYCPCCSLPIFPTPLPLSSSPNNFKHLGLLFPLYFTFLLYMIGYLSLTCFFSLLNIHLNLTGRSCSTATFQCVTSLSNIVVIGNGKVSQLSTVSINNYLLIAISIVYFELVTVMMRRRVTMLREFVVDETEYCLVFRDVEVASHRDIFVYVNTLQKRRYVNNKILAVAELGRQEEGNAVLKDSKQAGNIGLKEQIDQRIPFVRKGPVDFVVVFEYPISKYEFGCKNIEQMPDNTDRIWQNLGKKPPKQVILLRQILVCALILFIFLIIVLLKQINNDYIYQQPRAIRIIFNLGVSGIVAIFNSLIGIVIRHYARKQHHQTHSKFFQHVCYRLTLLFFLNMVLSTILANTYILLQRDTIHNQLLPFNLQNLSNDFFFLFMTNPYMSSIFNYFDLVYGRRLVKKQMVVNKGSFEGYQLRELKEMFEGHPVDMGLRFAVVLKTVFFVGMVGCFVPVGAGLSVMGLGVCYWVDKYLLLNRYISKAKLSDEFAMEMCEFSKYTVVLCAFSNVVMQIMPLREGVVLRDVTNIHLPISIVFFIISLVYKFGFKSISRKLATKYKLIDYKNQNRPLRHSSYRQAQPLFKNHLKDHIKLIDADLISNSLWSKPSITSQSPLQIAPTQKILTVPHPTSP